MSKIAKLPFILYFLNGPQATAADIAGARALKCNVAFRNGQQVPAQGSLETCDGVAATAPYAVPARYAAAFPTAEAAIAKYEAGVAAAAAKVGGTPEAPLAASVSGAAAIPAVAGAEKAATETAAALTKANWKPNA